MEKKLGWGNFSTVWQCKDLVNRTQVAVKVNKSHKDVAEMAKDEIKLLQCIGKASATHSGSKFVMRLVGQFKLYTDSSPLSPNGSLF